MEQHPKKRTSRTKTGQRNNKDINNKKEERRDKIKEHGKIYEQTQEIIEHPDSTKQAPRR